MVRNDACLYAGKAHASVITVFKYLRASEEMKTVQRMNANYLILFTHVVSSCRFCFSLVKSVETLTNNNKASSVPSPLLTESQRAVSLTHSSPHMGI